MIKYLKDKELGKLEVYVQNENKDKPCYRHDIIYGDCISNGLNCEKCYYRFATSNEGYLR